MALLPGGGYAEQVVVPAAHIMPIPEGLSFAQAAAIPEAFLTAQEALFSLGNLKSQETVLIHAAGGGVGSAAVQLAKQQGAHIVATASRPEKLKLAQKFGAKRVVNYRSENFATACMEETGGQGVSLIIDFVGAAHASLHQKSLGLRGRWIVVGVLGGARVELNFAQLLSKRWELRGLVMRSRTDEEKAAIVQNFTKHWLGHFASKKLVPVLDKEFALEDVALAQQRMEDNANLGKVILLTQS